LVEDAQAFEYLRATDTVMKYVSVNEKVMKQIADYLLRGFEQLNMDTVLFNFYTKYVGVNSCENSLLNDRIKFTSKEIKNCH
jgi:hypothetical protein